MGREQVGQYFETDRGQVVHRVVQDRSAHHEEPAHRIRQIGRHHQSTEPHGKTAHTRTTRVPIADIAARRVAAAHHDIGIALLQNIEHLRQQTLVVLKIRIDHRKIVSRGGEHALDAGRRKTAAADSAHASDPAVGRCVPAHHIGGAVG